MALRVSAIINGERVQGEHADLGLLSNEYVSYFFFGIKDFRIAVDCSECEKHGNSAEYRHEETKRKLAEQGATELEVYWRSSPSPRRLLCDWRDSRSRRRA
jgi:hypothetical protein